MLIVSAIITGLGIGSMYGLLALGYYITYSASGTVNFAQGGSMMLGAVVCYYFSVTLGWSMPVAIAGSLIACGIWGAVVERFVVRPFAREGSNAWLMSTVAAGIMLENVVMFTYGKEPRMLPSLAPAEAIIVGDLHVPPLQILIPAVGLAAGVGLHLFSRFTRQGKAMRAVVQNPDSSRLVGIDVSRVITFSFVVSTVFAGVAGILIAPLFNVSSDMGTLFGVKAFAAAPVLKRVELTVKNGEFVTVLGANGAGKTTLLRAISGLHRPVKGAVMLLGSDIASFGAHRIAGEGLVLAPEERQVFPELTVRDNICLGAYTRGDFNADEEIEAMVASPGSGNKFMRGILWTNQFVKAMHLFRVK